MDPTKLLEADHRSVETLFGKIKRAKGQKRTPLVEQLATSLRGHMELEERVLYPAMEKVTGGEMLEEATVEHELARKTLAEMLNLAPDKPGFEAALESVKAGVMHHVEEEEGQVFPKLRRKGKAILDDIATPFMQARLELGLPMDATALAAASTKGELVAEAKNAGVQNATTMSKEQLAKALARKMAA